MGITNLDEHTGLTKELRVLAVPPTEPTPVAGDIYVDSTTGGEAVGIYNGTSWVYLSLTV